jgi:hypothetical protein
LGIDLFLRSRSRSGRAFDFAGTGSAGTETRDDHRTKRSRRGLAHMYLPFLPFVARLTTCRAY